MILYDGWNQSTSLGKIDFHGAASLKAKKKQPKNKKPAELCAGGLKSALSSELLCTPQQARRMAVMMMMRAAVEFGAHF
jgi:hypothetical protein